MNIQKKSIKSLVDNRQPVYVQFLVCSFYLSLFLTPLPFRCCSLRFAFFSIVFLSHPLPHSPFERSLSLLLSQPFFRLVRFVSFAAFSLIITIYVMIFVNEHTKMPDYYQTIILINLWSEIEFISFATLHSHGQQSWSLLLLLLLFFTASIE